MDNLFSFMFVFFWPGNWAEAGQASTINCPFNIQIMCVNFEHMICFVLTFTCVCVCCAVLCSELYTLLLEDILVLLQRQDEKLVLKCHSKNLAGTAETKHIFSPIIKLSTVLVRSVATGASDQEAKTKVCIRVGIGVEEITAFKMNECWMLSIHDPNFH